MLMLQSCVSFVHNYIRCIYSICCQVIRHLLSYSLDTRFVVPLSLIYKCYSSIYNRGRFHNRMTTCLHTDTPRHLSHCTYPHAYYMYISTCTPPHSGSYPPNHNCNEASATIIFFATQPHHLCQDSPSGCHSLSYKEPQCHLHWPPPEEGTIENSCLTSCQHTLNLYAHVHSYIQRICMLEYRSRS